MERVLATLEAWDGALPPSLPAVTISGGNAVTEGGDASFTLRAHPAPASDLPVDVTIADDAGSDFLSPGDENTRTVTIPASGTATFTVPTVDDANDEADGAISAKIGTGRGYDVGSPSTALVTVNDNDGTPVVTIEGGADANNPLTEGDLAVFVLTATPAPGSDLTINVAVADHAGSDFLDPGDEGTRSVIIPASGTATLYISTLSDRDDEASGAISATVEAGTGYSVGKPSTAGITVIDDDGTLPPTPRVTVVGDAATAAEGYDAIFTLTASPAPQSPLTVYVTVADDADSDFVTPGNEGTHTVTIKRSGTALLTVPTVDDRTDEADGAVTVTVDTGTGYDVGSPSEASVSVSDNDDGGAPPPLEQSELVASIQERVDRTDANGDAHSNRIWRRALAAVRDEAPPAGQPRMTETEAQRLADGHRHRNNTELAGLWQQIADALSPVMSIATGEHTVDEGEAAVFTLTATPPPSAPLRVKVDVQEQGGFAKPGTRWLTVPTSGSYTLRLKTDHRSGKQEDGFVKAVLVDDGGYTISAVADTAEVTVLDIDDLAPVGDLSCSLPADAVTVGLVEGWRDDPRHSGNADHVERWNRVLATLDPTLNHARPMKAWEAQKYADFGWAPWVRTAATLKAIEQCRPQKQVTVAAVDGSVTEGGEAVFTFTATPAPADPLTVNVWVREVAGTSFVAADRRGAQQVTIGTDGAGELRIPMQDDNTLVKDGRVEVSIVSAGAWPAYTPHNQAHVTVTDDDTAGALTISFDPATKSLEAPEHGVFQYRVTLSGKASQEVRVFWSVESGTASEWTDFDANEGPISFLAGEQSKTFYIFPKDDAHDEGRETFRVILRNPIGAVIGDGEASGVIVNSDPMPAAWLARFGRTVAEQALVGIAGRMTADRAPGMRGSLAGQAIGFDPWTADTGVGGLESADREAVLANLAQPASGPIENRLGVSQPEMMTMHDLLLGSSFSLTGRGDASGGSTAFWGRASRGTFDGKEGEVALDGEVTTGMLGADYARGRWLVGLALTQSEGEGGYRDGTEPGKVESSLTAAIPYASLRASDRLKLWGAVGHGWGEVTLEPDEGSAMTADTDWTMTAAGFRSDLLVPSAEGDGPTLALVSDALWAGTSLEKAKGLAASDTDVTRLRLGLEGSWRMTREGGGSLSPKLEIGARHDGGDAETGFGMEIGGGIAWADPATGLSLDIEGRTLLAHEDGDLKDRGLSASLAYDPSPATERGPSFSLRQEFGSRASGGLDALFANAPLEDRTGTGAASRWAAEAAYGFPAFNGRFTGSPHVGVGLATGARDYGLGWRLMPAANAPAFSFGVKATRRESDTAAAEHAVGLEVRTRW